MMVYVEMGCGAKECRFHFFVDGDIAAGKYIIYNYGAYIMVEGYNIIVLSFII